ncbi:MAG: hypothetical protein PHR77_06465 [Kiritimatiellae bacterium]|nr:hypothetical protein [Kiritimatiellia bacterium]MDD5523092.1 hypothetical protein [Kiritimatiellia bacterium]
MKWVETIRVLCSLQDADAFKDELVAQLCDFRGIKGIKKISIMLQSAYEHDIAVALFWNKQQQPTKTVEGVFIANYLKQFGSVNHSVWTVFSEIDGKSRG